MCVHCHFQKYIRGSKRVLNTHGRNRGPKRLIEDQVQVFPTPSTRPSRHFWLNILWLSLLDSMNWYCTMMYVHYHFPPWCVFIVIFKNTYVDQKEYWTHMEGIEAQRGWLGTKSKCSLRPPLGHHVTFGSKMERNQGKHILNVGFGLQHITILWRTPRERSSTSCNLDEVKFHTDLDWCPYLSWDVRNQRIIDRSFSVQGVAPPYFGPMGCVSSWVY
jgi:hypothetical protein